MNYFIFTFLDFCSTWLYFHFLLSFYDSTKEPISQCVFDVLFFIRDSGSVVTPSERGEQLIVIYGVIHHHTLPPSYSVYLTDRLNRKESTKSGPNFVCWLDPHQPTNTHWSKVSLKFIHPNTHTYTFIHTDFESVSFLPVCVQASSTAASQNRDRLSQ